MELSISAPEGVSILNGSAYNVGVIKPTAVSGNPQNCIHAIYLTWLPITTPMFRPYVTGSDESGWGHLTGESVSPSVLLLHRSLSSHLWFIFPVLPKYGFQGLFVLSLLLLQQMFTFSSFQVILWFFLLVYHTFFEAERHFTLRIDSEVRDSDVRDGCIGPN